MQPDQANWLADFVQSVSRNRRQMVSPPVNDWIEEGILYLDGSIGYDTILRVNGEVWIYEYGLTDKADPGTWRQAIGNDRILCLAIGARRYPELGRLLPARPDASHPCEFCKGTGFLFIVVVCGRCSGLGWLPDSVE
jgi:hypothetical protein